MFTILSFLISIKVARFDNNSIAASLLISSTIFNCLNRLGSHYPNLIYSFSNYLFININILDIEMLSGLLYSPNWTFVDKILRDPQLVDLEYFVGGGPGHDWLAKTVRVEQ